MSSLHSTILLLLLVIVLATACCSQSATAQRVVQSAIYRYDADPMGKYVIVDASKSPDGGAATQLCYFQGNFTFFSTGWDTLRLTPSPSILMQEPLVARYACGYLEAYHTTQLTDGASILDNNYSTTPAISTASRLWMMDQISYIINYSSVARQNLTVKPTVKAGMTNPPAGGGGRGSSSSSSIATLGNNGENAEVVMQQSVAMQLRLLEGLTDGINRAIDDHAIAVPKWKLYDTYLLAINAELADIDVAAAGQYHDDNYTRLPPGNNNADHHGRDAAAMSSSSSSRPEGIAPHPRPRSRLHCSAFVKIIDGDCLVAHNTWAGYNFQYRQFKTYDWEVSVSFSGYPGIHSSVDDYTTTGSKLVTTETTNDQDNTALSVNFTKPQSVPYFFRYTAANIHAQTGPAWVKLFLTQNSGTYNNQQIVVDMKLFDTGVLPANFLWIAEQMPGNYSRTADVTSVLNADGAWYSFNIPYFKSVRNINMDTYYQAVFGNFFSHTKYARAKIFARDGPKVTDLTSAKALIRSNNWKNDPLSAITNCTGCNPARSPHLAIANRADLVTANATWGDLGADARSWYSLGSWGGIDAKVVSWKMMMDAAHTGDAMQAHIVSGPTWDQQPAFQWSTAPASVQKQLHRGQPDAWKFDWQVVHVGSLRLSPEAQGFFRKRNGGKDGGGGSNVGRNVGILIGALAGIALVAAAVYFIQAAWKRNQSGSSEGASGGVRRSAVDMPLQEDTFCDDQTAMNDTSSVAVQYRQMEDNNLQSEN